MKPITPIAVFENRRNILLKAIGDAILILPAATELTRNRDCHFPFRQDSDFLYLTNFIEPNAILVLDGKNQQSILFSQPYDELQVIWEGDIIGQERAKSDYLFDAAYPIQQLDEKLLAYFYAYDTVIFPFSRYQAIDNLVLDLIKRVKDTRRARSPQELLHSDLFIHPMRMIKDEYEIAIMQYAADISVKAHSDAMALTQINQNESEVAAVFDYHFLKSGGTAAYKHIVAGGNNACTLHYNDNNQLLKNNELLLIDAGCEYSGYASDITRTFPVNGQFTVPQKRVYKWVLKSMKAAFIAAKPGASIRSPHFAAEDVLIEGMLDLGLVTGTVDSVKADKSYQRYFMHGTSHWLGIDVHDVGDYKDKNGEWIKLLPGMVITVEPGLYIREDDLSAPEELRGIGIRIEDDLLITKDGYHNLTDALPKEIDEVEEICSKVINLA